MRTRGEGCLHKDAAKQSRFGRAHSILYLHVPVGLSLKVALIKVVHAHETVFPSRCVTRASGVDCDPNLSESEADTKLHETYVLIGPKWPFTRPTSSSNTLCQNRVSNLP